MYAKGSHNSSWEMGTTQLDTKMGVLTNFPTLSMAMRCIVQTHGLVHLRNVQAHSSARAVQSHSSARNVRAMRDHPTVRRSRSPMPSQSRVRLTPGPHGVPEDEEDWGDWTRAGRTMIKGDHVLLQLCRRAAGRPRTRLN